MDELSVASIDKVREALAPLKQRHLERLATLSGVPWLTIYKIKRGETENPGIETVRKFAQHIAQALADVDAPAQDPATGPGALDEAKAVTP